MPSSHWTRAGRCWFARSGMASLTPTPAAATPDAGRAAWPSSGGPGPSGAAAAGRTGIDAQPVLPAHDSAGLPHSAPWRRDDLGQATALDPHRRGDAVSPPTLHTDVDYQSHLSGRRCRAAVEDRRHRRCEIRALSPRSQRVGRGHARIPLCRTTTATLPTAHSRAGREEDAHAEEPARST